MTPDETSAYYARKGIPTIEKYDRRRILDSVRETRRRYARQEASKAIDEIVDHARTELCRELGINAAPADTLLHVASLLGAYVAHGLSAEHVLNVLARIADDLDAETPPGVPPELAHLAELVKGQGTTTWCGCGDIITWFEDRWMHVYNPALIGADDHEPDPS